VSHTFEDTLDFSLDIKNTKAASSSIFHHSVKYLETCLKEFITNEFIEGYVCTKCKKRNTSLKKMTIWKQPETLVVQFKRFVYDNYGDRHAVKERVAFPLDHMSLDAFMHERSNGNFLDKTMSNSLEIDLGKRYRLYGIVNHMGGLDNGHYIA